MSFCHLTRAQVHMIWYRGLPLTHRRNKIMCTWYQGCGNCSCKHRCGCAQTYGNGCGQARTGGCFGQSVANTTFFGGSYNGCSRYVSFPISGTAYVPTSAIYFCPNVLGTAQNGTGNASNGSSGGGCCFGRCGGAAAISNYYEDYYARQYGLND